MNGIPIAAINLATASRYLGSLATISRGAYVAVTGAHGIVESLSDEQVREAHLRAAVVVPDGMPLVWLGRALGHRCVDRVYGPDLMQSIFAQPKYRELRHFFYGSRPVVVSRLKHRLVSQFGKFNDAGTHCPPIQPRGFHETDNVLQRIRKLEPNFIWVSLSTPKQELWMHMHMHKIGCGVGIGVGAAFDLLAGSIKQSPKWIQRSGLEWLFRTVQEPRRLATRYAVVVPRFAGVMVETVASSYFSSISRNVHR